ncbi:MAG: formate dehydrogenase subunit gamma [Alphaproteobacteria bacterium]
MRLRPEITRLLCLGILALALLLTGATAGAGLFGTGSQAWAEGASSVRPPGNAVNVAPSRPGKITPQGQDTQKWGAGKRLPTTASAQPGTPRLWRDIRRGVRGTVSIPNKKAGYLVRSEGEMWRQYRLSTLSNFGSWVLLVTVVVLAAFFLLRGRLKVDGGLSGKLIERFSSPERFAHWLAATSFIILGISGLMLLYGRDVLIPVFGREGFSVLAGYGKIAHNYVGFAFIVGIVMMLVLWIRDNLPDKYDIPWLMALGGFFKRGVHPPAAKFNTGQKVIFWSVVGGGGLIAASGVLLLFPAARTLQDIQFLQTWHALLALVLIAIIIAHIYIGSLGMQGAFQAMGSGKVDRNWAKQHHSVWVKEMKGPGAAKGKKS